MSKARTHRWAIAVPFILAAALTFTAASSAVYTGYLSAPATSGLYTGPGGVWSHDVTLMWVVDSNTTEPNRPAEWHYYYRFTVLNTFDDLIKYFVLETSPSFNPTVDLLNLNWKPGTYTVGMIDSNGSPGMPEAMQGIKFNLDGNRYTTLIIDFYSPRAPMWGDFYALGPTDVSGVNYVFNQGYKKPDTDPNVSVYPLQNNPVFNHLLVPDTKESNQPVGEFHILQVFKFLDVDREGAVKNDPNFRLADWRINVDGNDLSHFDANTDSAGATLFGPLNGAVSWRVWEELKSGWTFTGAWLYNDANGAFIGQVGDPNAIYVNLATMDVNVFIGNIPEPGTLVLTVAGCAALGAMARRRRARR